MRISLYNHERDPFAKPREVTEAELIQLLTTHIERVPKEGVAWSPASLNPCPTPCVNTNKGKKSLKCAGGELHRHERNVASHAVVVFDVDHKSDADASAIVERVQASGLRAVVHSSHSHNPPNDCCLRVVLFPARAILASEVRTVRNALVKALGIPVDPATKDLSRLYYLPAHHPDRKPFTLTIEGEVFDVDPLLVPAEVNGVAAVTVPGTPPELVYDLDALRAALKSATNPTAKEAIKRVLSGEALADYGSHDATLQSIAGTLATYLPEGTPYVAVVALCELSLRRMEWQDGWDHLLEAFEDKWSRAVERVAEFRAQRKAQFAELLAKTRKDAATKTIDPLAAEVKEDGTYSDAALEEWAIGEHEWIIQKGDTFWVFVDGRYIPRMAKELPNCIYRDLLRAPLALQVEGPKGTKELTVSEILRAYGTVTEKVEANLIDQRSHYDPITGTFHEAVAKRRFLKPEFNQEIQNWLEILGGADKDKLLDWVATVTDLSKASCALYLHGAPGSGKTLLAKGLARIWAMDTTSLEDVYADFNDAVSRCPLIFADERVPDRRNITEDIRAMVGTVSRNFKRKYMPAADLVGAVRLILAANNPDLLRTTRDLTRFDLEATAQRVMYLEVTTEVSKYLTGLGGQAALNDWILQDKIAMHALWLKDHRAVLPTKDRFLVSAPKAKFYERLVTGSGVGQQVCDVLVKALENYRPNAKAQMDNSNNAVLVAGSGEILVSARFIELRLADTLNPPTFDRIAKALRSLSYESAKVYRLSKDKTIRLARVRPDQLYAWAEETEAVDVGELKKIVDTTSELVEGWLKRKTA